MLWPYVISDLNGEDVNVRFYEKKVAKTNQKEFRVEKAIKKNGDMLNGKATQALLKAGSISKSYYKSVNIFQNWDLQEKEWKLN